MLISFQKVRVAAAFLALLTPAAAHAYAPIQQQPDSKKPPEGG
ncbi:hypothetical protein [Gluconacetobacter entanii]|nr:hypothetical protein [Gluconacetobacter entanii]MCW4579661.1 hypothetical protein [Gluconacetobacter entanii]